MKKGKPLFTFNSNLFQDDSEELVRGRYLFHDVVLLVFQFFFGPRHEKDDDLNLLDQAKILLESRGNAADRGTVDLCHRLIQIHRVHENTKSRKRLEIWAAVVISIYLIIICLIFVFNSLKLEGRVLLDCNTNLMIALLTTTTINILGLVVIVLKGYFPQTSSSKKDKEEKDLGD